MGEMQAREVLPQLGPRVWWVFLRLDSPRSARELAQLGAVTAATVEGHLRTLKARGLVDRLPGEAGERRFRQAVRLSQDQLDQVGAKVAAANNDPAVHKMTRVVWRASPPSRFQVRCEAVRCPWVRDQSDGTEAHAVDYFDRQWREHIAGVTLRQHRPPVKPTSDVQWASVFFGLAALAVAVLVLMGVVALLSGGGGGGPGDTCDGYRADVVDGSAQDVRDSRNLSNPCD